MSDKRNTSSSSNAELVERAVVLQLLRDDHPEQWLREELTRELENVPSGALDAALLHLERRGVVRRSGDLCWASRAIRRLDELDLIGV
jgi:DNA-binding HxlR family transcriptional regulator